MISRFDGFISEDEFESLANELAESFPKEFFEELNGGILVLERSKMHRDSWPGNELYILGEYCHGGELGRYINLYYGSFRRVYPDFGRDALRGELRKTIAHEFRHHMESLAMCRDLEVEDEEVLEAYNSRFYTARRKR
jgi:hypothetical protein